ncbi:MAG: DMT family transporter [Desulfobacterales bacterium]|nr:DMT family transporter [Desulfobacterales bacterium]
MPPSTPESAPPAGAPLLALGLGVLAVSTGAIFARLADAPALVTAAYRVGLATLVLAPFAWWRGRGELRALSAGQWRLAILSGFFLALHFATWISSLDYTSVANSVVLVNTNPLWVGLLTPLIAREPIRRAALISILISVVGAVIIGLGDFAGGGRALWGDALALAGSICAALYLLLGRRLRQRLSLLGYVFICYGSAAVFLWLAVLALGLPVRGFSGVTWGAFWAMALFTQLVGHTCYNWALKWFSAALIAVSLLGEPIGSTILAYILFQEGLSWLKILGAGLILLAIYWAATGEK